MGLEQTSIDGIEDALSNLSGVEKNWADFQEKHNIVMQAIETIRKDLGDDLSKELHEAWREHSKYSETYKSYMDPQVMAPARRVEIANAMIRKHEPKPSIENTNSYLVKPKEASQDETKINELKQSLNMPIDSSLEQKSNLNLQELVNKNSRRPVNVLRSSGEVETDWIAVGVEGGKIRVVKNVVMEPRRNIVMVDKLIDPVIFEQMNP